MDGAKVDAGMPIIDSAGNRAEVVAVDYAGSEDMVVARLADGRQMAFPLSLLDAGGAAPLFHGNFLELAASANSADGGDTADAPPDEAGSATAQAVSGQETMVIPVVEEAFKASKRAVDTGRGVRVTKSVSTHAQTVDLPLMQEEITVERVPRGTLLAPDETPGQRQEGDTLVLPVLEEVLVVEKRLRLTEEIRITRRRCETHKPQEVELRREHVRVERFVEPRED